MHIDTYLPPPINKIFHDVCISLLVILLLDITQTRMSSGTSTSTGAIIGGALVGVLLLIGLVIILVIIIAFIAVRKGK